PGSHKTLAEVDDLLETREVDAIHNVARPVIIRVIVRKQAEHRDVPLGKGGLIRHLSRSVYPPVVERQRRRETFDAIDQYRKTAVIFAAEEEPLVVAQASYHTQIHHCHSALGRS